MKNHRGINPLWLFYLCFALELVLGLAEAPVGALFRHEFLMGAGFHYLAFVDEHYFVAVFDGGQSVGHDYGSPAL